MQHTAAPGSHPLLVPLLTLGVFGILNTEMGVIGMLPLIADTFQVTVPQAGWTVTLFALVVAVVGPVMPLLFSRFERKSVMLLALGVFVVSNAVAMLTDSFAVLLVTRVIPAFFHPVYVSMAFTVAAASVPPNDAPKAVAHVFIGVSAGMVLGVPAASFMASEISYTVAMGFFLVVNLVVFAATLLIMPSMPATGRRSYGEQLRVLKKPALWYAVAAVVCINGAVFGFFSYLSDYLNTVTLMSFTTISLVLFIYGAANIVGNLLAGRLLVRHDNATIRLTPFALGAGLVLLFIMGQAPLPMTGLVLLFGILAGLAANNGQYLLVRAAAEAPEFANGLFLSSANWGTALGTPLCGLFIETLGTRYAIMGALICLAAGIFAVFFACKAQTIEARNSSGGQAFEQTESLAG